MQKLNPNLFTNNQINTKQQLIDSLTAHISLYHKKSPTSNPNPNPRSAILKWFSSLSVHQRRAHLTIVDYSFVQILLQMLHKLHSNGHGFFIILPDIPSRDHLTCVSNAKDNSAFVSLPSLCFRKSQGLLARVSESNEWERVVYELTRLFSSKEGENVGERRECCLDAMTVGEELVENVDKFVEVMDGISNGQFLRGEENGSGLGTEWVELEWLKEKGYYSMEAFVVNRLEVALRLAWLNCNSGKKRGVKLKDKLNAAGVAANVFWRKKGCVDWWEKLDEATRKKVFRVFLGKAAKSLTAEFLRGKAGKNDEMWSCCSGREHHSRCNGFLSRHKSITHRRERHMIMDCCTPPSVCGYLSLLDCMFRSLYILQSISTLLVEHSAYNQEQIFFSSLDSASTISDCILRKLRDILMVVSFDYTKLELLQEDKLNFPPKKQEKLGASKRKKKGKNHGMKKQNSGHRSSEEDLNLVSVARDNGNGPGCSKDLDINHSSRLAYEVQQKDHAKEIIQPAVEMGHGERSNNGTVRGASRRSKKKRNKDKNTSSPPRKLKDSSVSVNSQDGAADSMASEESLVENMPASAAMGNHRLEPVSTHSRPTRADMGSQLIQRHHDPSIVDGSTDPGYQSLGRGLDNSSEISKDDVGSGTASVTHSVEFNNDQNSVDSNYRGWKHANPKDTQLGSLGTQTSISERSSIGTYDVRAINSPAYISYEWPSVAPGHLPSANSHLPAATDRLHLEVGHNWKNHLYQPFLQPMHQVRNPPIENGHRGIVSRPLQMSLDWPPMVRGVSGMTPSVTCNYDSEFITRRQSSFQQAFTAQSVQGSSVTAEDERTYSGDFVDFPDLINAQELTDEHENHWMSEEELEVQTVSGMDYNQYFGGGVMYWTPDDYLGASFSHPPSLSSDDSSWAWREADMTRAVDDMVAFSSSYSTNGLTSPSAASYCSPFDPLGPGHQALGYVISENEISGKVLHPSSTVTDVVAEESASGSLSNLPGDGEAKSGDSLPCPILRPIIIPNMSRERSRSEFKRNHDHRSPCIPPNRREQPRIKRPPSPVVLCVPRAPRPPPPSPVGDSRKHRGFPTVRSGSSSPRHWGVRGWFHDGNYLEETSIRMDSSEVVWASWRNKSLSARQLTQPVPGALLQDRLIAISQLARDQEHPDVAFPLQPPDVVNCLTHKESLSLVHSLLHDEIDSFCKQVAAENMIRKPYINWAVKRVARSLQVLWPRSRTNVFGSNATGLSLPSSDVDLVVCLPPVRNLEPIKEAGILEGRNGIKETCLQHAARYLANQEWVKNDSLKIVENTAIPIIMLVVEVPHDLIASSATNVQSTKQESIQVASEQIDSCHADAASDSSASSKLSMKKNDNSKDVKSVRLDISFKSLSHTGLQTTELVKELTEQFPAAIPLALVLKQFLADRSLDQSYSGGLSSYSLVLLITRFLQHEHHHGCPVNQNYGSLLMDFFYFFGNVFDPRQMRISVQGSGLYIKRESGHSIDPLCIDDPLFPTNNVGRNCFRIHQCIKAFADAYSTLKSELQPLSDDETRTKPSCKLLPKIIPSIGRLEGS